MKTNRPFNNEPHYWNGDEPRVNPRLGCLIVAICAIVGVAFWSALIYILA